MRRSYGGGRISLHLFGATCGSILRNPSLKKKWDAGGRKCAALYEPLEPSNEGTGAAYITANAAESPPMTNLRVRQRGGHQQLDVLHIKYEKKK